MNGRMICAIIAAVGGIFSSVLGIVLVVRMMPPSVDLYFNLAVAAVVLFMLMTALASWLEDHSTIKRMWNDMRGERGVWARWRR